MRVKAVAVTLTALFLAASAFVGVSATAQDGHVKWLYLLYLDADNDLDTHTGPGHASVVESDYAELMSVGSTKDVACYVLVDRWHGPANLFKIEKGSMNEIRTSTLNGKEINMGDPNTLSTFISDASKANPADRTLLVFWDHGSPLRVAKDEHVSDSGGNDILTHDEVISVIKDYRIDVLCADECNVGQIEVAYEYATRTPTECFVAAQTYTGWRGFPYDLTLKALTGNPDMTANQAAVMMVEQTQLLLNKPPYMGEAVNTHSAVDLSLLPQVVSSLKALTDLLVNDIDVHMNAIVKARGIAQYCYGANALNLIDFRTFVATLGDVVSSKEVKDACAAVLKAFDAAILDIHAIRALQSMVNGLGVLMPDHSSELPDYYEKFAFESQGWLDLLEAYWAAHGVV